MGDLEEYVPDEEEDSVFSYTSPEAISVYICLIIIFLLAIGIIVKWYNFRTSEVMMRLKKNTKEELNEDYKVGSHDTIAETADLTAEPNEEHFTDECSLERRKKSKPK